MVTVQTPFENLASPLPKQQFLSTCTTRYSTRFATVVSLPVHEKYSNGRLCAAAETNLESCSSLNASTNPVNSVSLTLTIPYCSANTPKSRYCRTIFDKRAFVEVSWRSASRVSRRRRVCSNLKLLAIPGLPKSTNRLRSLLVLKLFGATIHCY